MRIVIKPKVELISILGHRIRNSAEAAIVNVAGRTLIASEDFRNLHKNKFICNDRCLPRLDFVVAVRFVDRVIGDVRIGKHRCAYCGKVVFSRDLKSKIVRLPCAHGPGGYYELVPNLYMGVDEKINLALKEIYNV